MRTKSEGLGESPPKGFKFVTASPFAITPLHHHPTTPTLHYSTTPTLLYSSTPRDRSAASAV